MLLTVLLNRIFAFTHATETHLALLIRDIFLFSCYTGLAYIDIKELSEGDIQTSFDGNKWIMTHRHKTKTPVNVPLLDIPQAIIQKYKGQCKNGMLLPVPSNQKTN